MFIVGLDVGYSNLKLVFSDHEDPAPQAHVLPAGAGPKECMPDSFMKRTAKEGVYTDVDGRLYVAGVDPGMLQGWQRELHEDYPSTASYKALFHASLLLAGQDEIDCLVTGLPVNQYLNGRKKDELKARLQGTHHVTPARQVHVRDVQVIGQPLGAFVNAVMEQDEEDLLLDAKALIFDMGFFSVDWVLIHNQRIVRGSSGSSVYATSWIFDQTRQGIALDYGRAPSLEQLEAKIRRGETEVSVFGKKIDFSDYLHRAAQETSRTVIAALKQSLRSQMDGVDVIILTGGGGTFYQQAVAEAFPDAALLAPNDMVTANALGFWYFGKI